MDLSPGREMLPEIEVAGEIEWRMRKLPLYAVHPGTAPKVRLRTATTRMVDFV
jgi:hypothetical protein